MCRPKIERVLRVAAAAATLGIILAGCSDLYYARRDSIALGAGDSVAANAAEQTYDPWPRASGNVNIASNGQRIQSAVERYRNNKVIPPVDPESLEQTNQTPPTTVNVTSAPPTPAQ